MQMLRHAYTRTNPNPNPEQLHHPSHTLQGMQPHRPPVRARIHQARGRHAEGNNHAGDQQVRIHTTKDGTKIKLCDLTDSHLASTIRMLERKASEGITVRMGGGSCPDHIEGKIALEHMGYADYVKERDRRISNTNISGA